MDIISLARDFGKEIQKTDEYLELIRAKKENDNDEELNDLIGKLNLLKFDIQRLLADHEDQQEKIDEKNSELSEIYGKIMTNKNMIAFNKASDNMNAVMNKINGILMAAVNGEDPLMFSGFNNFECGGGCSGCSGCH